MRVVAYAANQHGFAERDSKIDDNVCVGFHLRWRGELVRSRIVVLHLDGVLAGGKRLEGVVSQAVGLCARRWLFRLVGRGPAEVSFGTVTLAKCDVAEELT